MTMMEEKLLVMRGITKEFPGVKALDHVELQLTKGTVHALMGENGAGKSTLMKILMGIYQPDDGEIILNGQKVKIESPKRAHKLGISMIHQELMPILDMSVADNIFLYDYPARKGIVQKSVLYQKTEALFRDLGIEGIDSKAFMKELSQAQMQMVEIAKAVSAKADVIIMDEPTSAISDHEVENLFRIIRTLRAKGVGILYISHKMDEIFKISDFITVLRDGQYIGSAPSIELDQEKLVSLMVGRELKAIYDRHPAVTGEVMLEVRHLKCKGVCEDVSFKLHKGEVLGFAGLVGAGRTEIMEAIFGLRKRQGGEIIKEGKKLDIRSVRDAINHGLALASEDRKRFGLFLDLPISYNISISWLNNLAKVGIVNRGNEKEQAYKFSKDLRIKSSSIKTKVGKLSGGNQQKVVLAKWLLTKPDILILDEPARGIDIGAKQEIYTLIEQMAHEGKGVIVISSEMPELIGISDRIITVHEGVIKGSLTGKEITQERIMMDLG
ncbi:MAG: sugar ABC transporter ATP-binding protein [Clostridium sp.]|nr:sugar ABC transporter ATP-binding protein [Clostridium sp.]